MYFFFEYQVCEAGRIKTEHIWPWPRLKLPKGFVQFKNILTKELNCLSPEASSLA